LSDQVFVGSPEKSVGLVCYTVLCIIPLYHVLGAVFYSCSTCCLTSCVRNWCSFSVDIVRWAGPVVRSVRLTFARWLSWRITDKLLGCSMMNTVSASFLYVLSHYDWFLFEFIMVQYSKQFV